jgi:hypothetical protein
MLQLLMSVQVVAITRPVMVNEPVAPLARSPALNVNIYQLKDQAEAYNHVIPQGKVSIMTVPVATLGQRFPYVIVYVMMSPLIAHVKSTNSFTCTSARGVMVVKTIAEILLPVTVSRVEPVIEAVL